MRVITTDRAPAPAGHYSQAVVHGGLVFVAGQLPVEPGSADRHPGPIEQQTEQVLRNVAAILEAAGSGLEHLLQVTIYVADMAYWPVVNEVYARLLGSHRPARAVVPVRELHYGYGVEVQCIAALPGGSG